MEKSVLIVEDSIVQQEMLKELILEIDPGTAVYTAVDLDTAYVIMLDKSIDVFLVDIILDTTRPGDTSGIRLVKKIRTIPKYMFAPVVFITSLEDTTNYAYKDLNCLGYIEKPLAPEEFKQLMSKAMFYSAPEEADASYCFRKDGILYPVKVKNIIYMESVNHVFSIHMKKGGTLKIPYKTCKQLLNEVHVSCLIQCSRSVIVNKDYIQNIDIQNRYITMEDVPEKIVIGYTFKKKVLAEYGYDN